MSIPEKVMERIEWEAGSGPAPEPCETAEQEDAPLRRYSRRLSKEVMRRGSSVAEALPETSSGWAVLLSAVATAILGYELRLQRTLTCPPEVYGQIKSGPLRDVHDYMVKEKPAESILYRPIQPSLFVGTRAVMASTAAFMLGGPARTDRHIHFRQILTMTQDGAKIALDWELPILDEQDARYLMSSKERQREILQGPIQEPVVVVCHGINNDASFGYIRSMMRACTDRGWNAVGMNFRGCGGVPLHTPRGYNAAYTGDVRCVVHHLSGRLAPKVPLFLVGNSLGANVIAKYLGEEGLCGTLPECVGGGITMGNPMLIKGMQGIWSPVLAMGLKKFVLENWRALRQIKDPAYLSALRRAILTPSISDFDQALSPYYARNEAVFPFAFRIGFQNGHHYWKEASSFSLVPHISVPMLQLIAGDDFLVFNNFRHRILYNLSNPNIMVVETKCGGHLGWQESPPDGSMFGILGKSWADTAASDFIEAVLAVRTNKNRLSGVASKESRPMWYASTEDGSIAVDFNNDISMQSRL